MKLSAALAAILPGIAAATLTFRTPANRSHALRASHLAVSAEPHQDGPSSEKHEKHNDEVVEAHHHKAMEDLGLRKTSPFGNKDCRCVGIDKLNGSFVYEEAGQKLTYPADYGASCKAWEKNLHPDCEKEGAPDWCLHEWCFVDPCSCDIPIVPKKTTKGYESQGKPAYWSYATCGHADTWSADKTDEHCSNHDSLNECYQNKGCEWTKDQCVDAEFMKVCSTPIDEAVWGQDACRCIGISGREGVAHIGDGETTDGEQMKTVEYPVDIGAYCSAWEKDSHPKCKGPDSPPWCRESWCWVDPCKCKATIHTCGDDSDLDCVVPPKVSIMKNMSYQGKHVYFSYETCGSTDTWTQGHREQYCVSQRTPELCAKLGSRCQWTGLECVGKDLATQCSSASILRPVTVIIATLLALSLAL